MVVIDPRTLSASDRHALTAALAEPAPLEALAQTPTRASVWARLVLAFVVAVVGLALCGSRLEAGGNALVILCGVALALIGLAAVEARRRRALLLCPWRCGTFLYRFGVLVAEPTWIRYVPGAELDEPMFVARHRLQVRLSARGWSTVVPGDEARWQALAEVMDGLPYARWTRDEGYRGRIEPLASARTVRPSSSHRRRSVVAAASFALLGVLLGWTLVVPELALAGATGEDVRVVDGRWGRPWTHARARRLYADHLRTIRERIQHHADERFRSDVLALVPRDLDDGRLALDEEWSAFHCDARPFIEALRGEDRGAVMRSLTDPNWQPLTGRTAYPLHPLVALARERGSAPPTHRGRLLLSCEFSAGARDLPGSTRHRITTRATLSLYVEGHESVSRVIDLADPLHRSYEEWWVWTRNQLAERIRETLGAAGE